MRSTSGVTEAPPTTLGERVRAARRERGLSQSQLAGSELTKGFISQVESGQVRPSIRSLQVLASRLGKSLDYLLGDESLATAKRGAFHRLAAQAAAERGDWPTARAEIDQAMSQSPEPRERAGLLRILASAENATGDREAAFSRISEALTLLEPAADPIEYVQLLYVRGTTYSAAGQLVAATESYEAARDVVERFEVTEPRLRTRVQVALGTMYRRLNRTAKALSAYQSALALASRSSELDLAARGYMGIAVSLYDSGELDGAIANYQRALELFRRVSDTQFELNVMQSLAAVHFEQGKVTQAHEVATRARDRATSVGDARWAAVAEIVLARVALSEGLLDEALCAAEHAERALAEAHDELQRADALRVMGGALEALGRTADADASYNDSLRILETIGDRADLSAVAAEYAQKLRARGQVDAAFDMLERARGSSAKR